MGMEPVLSSRVRFEQETLALLNIPLVPDLTVCFIWHMHQPDYKDALTGRYMMPWVRLHGVKDYLDMVTLLEEFPKIKQTFNMVPSLMAQVEDYSRPGLWDRHQELTVQAVPYSDADRRFILERFFDAHPQQMIGRFPTYYELYQRRKQLSGAKEGASLFSNQEFADITALFHLCWFDPLWIEKNPELRALIAKGRNYSLADRQRILEMQRELVAQIIPTYKRLQDAGQIEITTTPYYHPILPLLIDSDTARIGRPSAHLPRDRFQCPEDARAHVEKAIESYTRMFGRKPVGIWPAEQSVSPEAMRLFKEFGFQWAVTSEGILSRSLDIHWDKDEYGHYRNIQELAAPYSHAGVNMLFRNLTLSDLIGFTYAGFDPELAATDCYQRIKKIQFQMAQHPEVARPVVTIALDGENCWESYAQDGLPFLRALYSQLSSDKTLNVSRVQDYFAACPDHAVRKLPYLHTGSWIESDFHIWIGDPIKNSAWDLLSQTRRDLVAWEAAQSNLDPAARAQVWEELYIAEGSDWFWWFGEPHNSGQDDLFDFQFRLHLKNVYQLMGQTPPEVLNVALSPINGKLVSEPTQLIHPTIDGILTSLDEWAGSGRFDLAMGEGAMHRGDRLATCLYYGTDDEWLYMRFNLQKDLLKPTHRLAIYLCNNGKTRYNSPVRLKARPGMVVPTQTYLYAYEIEITDLQSPKPKVATAESIRDHLWMDRPDMMVDLAMDEILEIAVPLNQINTYPGDSLGIAVAVADLDVILDFVPPHTLLPLHRPYAAISVEAESASASLQ